VTKYRDDNGDVVLRRSVVCYLDVLGVAALSRRGDAAETAVRLDRAIRDASTRYIDSDAFKSVEDARAHGNLWT
jgi:hypothetical protein